MTKKVTIPFIALILSIAFLGCNQSSKSTPKLAQLKIQQPTVDPYEVFIQKLGGPIGYDLEIASYLNRVLLRLNTLTAFRDFGISIELVNHHGSLCLYFDKGRLILSRGLLINLNNEAELVAAVATAMLTKITITNESASKIAKLPDELEEKDFSNIRFALKDSYCRFDLKKCEQIISSLGYSKRGLSDVLNRHKEMLLGLECQKFLAQGVLDHHITEDVGYLGEATYQKVISPLKMLEISYEQEQQSLEAFKKKNFQQAFDAIEKAILENPAEGHFYYTLSKIYAEQNLLGQSLRAIDQAIKLNSFNVHFYLQRAKIFQALAKVEEAKEDLKAADELLLVEPIIQK